jgi:hypothetical protein
MDRRCESHLEFEKAIRLVVTRQPNDRLSEGGIIILRLLFHYGNCPLSEM